VFIVGCLGDRGGASAEILSLSEGLSGNPPKSRKKGQDASTNIGDGIEGSGIIGTLAARDYKGVGNQYVAEGKVIPTLLTMREGSAGGGKGPLISSDISLTLATGNSQVLFGETGFAKYTENELKTLNATQHKRGTENVVVRQVQEGTK
jgi:hypothetical protein